MSTNDNDYNYMLLHVFVFVLIERIKITLFLWKASLSLVKSRWLERTCHRPMPSRCVSEQHLENPKFLFKFLIVLAVSRFDVTIRH